jgi:hypothetical protein
MRDKTIQYKVLFLLVMLLLSIPAIQMHTGLFHEKKLKGWFKEYKKPEFNIKDWLSGQFQEGYNNYFENNFGFRSWFVRIHNQISFSLSGETHAAGVIIGKDLYLYELNYIKAYNGTDFLGYNAIKGKVDTLEMISDSLNKRGGDLVICFAAGKGSFYPEYFPEDYRDQRSDSTNYIIYSELIRSRNLDFIDFNQWFLDMKDTSGYTLYPKYGIHWSEYGAALAADSLIRYIENLKHADVPDMEIEDIEISSKLKGVDYDIGESLNLIFQLSSDAMAYPKIKWNTDNKDTLKAIVISDSFYWQLFNFGVSTIAFRPGGFWYYNKVSHPGTIDLKTLDYNGNVYDSDVVILLCTEATLDSFPFGFIKDFFHGDQN